MKPFNMSQITTLTFFKYKGLKSKIWAFGMMQYAHKYLGACPGLQFYKLMGSGRGLGFNPFPDFSVYCLLQVWDSSEKADDFFDSNPLMQQYEANTEEHWTLFLKVLSSKGEWSKQNPFEVSNDIDPDKSEIAVITRATIKWHQLIKFWSYVPTSEGNISQLKGLKYTKGIGEVPLIQMATFSLWKDKKALQEFAYQSKGHQGAIQRTRKHDWYSEELFARFQVFKQRGSWEAAKGANHSAYSKNSFSPT